MPLTRLSPRLFVLVPLCSLLAACANVLPPSDEEVRGMLTGSNKDDVVTRYRQLLAEFDGWRVWQLGDGGLTTCMAMKAVPGTTWPSLERDTFLPKLGSSWATDRRFPSGGAGFFMYITSRVEIPYFGFYGKYPYRMPSVAERGGQKIFNVDNADTVLSWEGSAVAFKVNSHPNQEDYNNLHEASGVIDFTGVQRAYQMMMGCHARAPKQL
jgi:hypothetical protein